MLRLDIDRPVKLTSLSAGGGCGCKLSPAVLAQILAATRTDAADPELLVGNERSDDAAVYRLADDRALVFTTDFFTPVVDDGFQWGRIAATNALSDVYAMGGTPLLALNLVAWPREGLDFGMLEDVRGGSQAHALRDRRAG